MTDRFEITVEEFTLDEPPEDLGDFINLLKDKRGECPQGSTAKISLGSYEIDISYRRPETDEEMSARLATDQHYALLNSARRKREAVAIIESYGSLVLTAEEQAALVADDLTTKAWREMKTDFGFLSFANLMSPAAD